MSWSPTLIGKVMSPNKSVKEGGAMDKKWTVICPPGQRRASSSVSDVAHSFTDGSRFHSLEMWSAYKDNAPGDWSGRSIIWNRGTAVQLLLHEDKTMWRCSLEPTVRAAKHSHFKIQHQRVNGKLVSHHMRWRIWWKGGSKERWKSKE